MRFILAFVLILFSSCVNSKEKSYTGSTPVGAVVRSFFGIPPADSIDFMRWKLLIDKNNYTLICNYGVGKPNTNGFISGGKSVQFTGECRHDNNFYILLKNGKELKLLELNENLLHLADFNNNLLIGNSGWSYVLNSLSPVETSKLNITAQTASLPDSMLYTGRTPCAVPGIIPNGTSCYKLKWKLVFYADAANHKPTTYKVWGTPWRKVDGKTGRWKIRSTKDGQFIYELKDENSKIFLKLLKADENILLFTDENGHPLTGDEDFSYILNREK
ncbi:hypothetical protein [Terrimonas pollutisoli]|uniref:hypothetical protein n=1 Tax=Terrimonas pollutisoli TaxID=3034147 RepID=UPI0023EDDABB|nr:hypothetical protein [Terrimonas sp. H1YJ31]